MRIVVFFFIAFALLLGFTTFTNQRGGLAFGWHSFSTYGWPQPWLRVHTITKTTFIHTDGTKEGGERTIERSIDWQPLMISTGTCAGIALALSAPLYLWFSRREHENAAS
jgi:hypothetical protein